MADLPAESVGNAVPSCPGWDLADLLAHTGWVHRWMTHLLSLPEGERTSRERAAAAGLPKVGSAQRPEGDLRSWLRDSADGLADALIATPPAKRMVTAFGEHQPSLLARRAAHETAMHRWDAESAIGPPLADFEADLAADGVDELLGFWMPARFDHAGFGGRGETIELVPSDGGDPWSIVVDAESTTWRRGARTADPDVSVRGRWPSSTCSCGAGFLPSASPSPVTASCSLAGSAALRSDARPRPATSPRPNQTEGDRT